MSNSKQNFNFKKSPLKQIFIPKQYSVYRDDYEYTICDNSPQTNYSCLKGIERSDDSVFIDALMDIYDGKNYDADQFGRHTDIPLKEYKKAKLLVSFMNSILYEGCNLLYSSHTHTKNIYLGFFPAIDDDCDLKSDNLDIDSLLKLEPLILQNFDNIGIFFTVCPNTFISKSFEDFLISLYCFYCFEIHSQSILLTSIHRKNYIEPKIEKNYEVTQDNGNLGIICKNIKSKYFQLANVNKELHNYSIKWSLKGLRQDEYEYICELKTQGKIYIGRATSKNNAESLAFSLWAQKYHSVKGDSEIQNLTGSPASVDVIENSTIVKQQDDTESEVATLIPCNSIVSEVVINDPNILNVPLYTDTYIINANSTEIVIDVMKNFFEKLANANTPQMRIASNYTQANIELEIVLNVNSNAFNQGIWGAVERTAQNYWSFKNDRNNKYSYSQLNPVYLNFNAANIATMHINYNLPTRFISNNLNSKSGLLPQTISQIVLYPLSPLIITSAGTQEVQIVVDYIFKKLELVGRISYNYNTLVKPVEKTIKGDAGLLDIGKKFLSAQTGGVSDLGFNLLDKFANSRGMKGKHDYPEDPSQGTFVTPNFTSSMSVIDGASQPIHSFSKSVNSALNSTLEPSDSFIKIARQQGLFRQITVTTATSPGELLTSWSNTPRKPYDEYVEFPVGSHKRCLTPLACISDSFLNYSGKIVHTFLFAGTSKHLIKLLIVTLPLDDSVEITPDVFSLRNSFNSEVEFGSEKFSHQYVAPFFGNKKEMRVLDFNSSGVGLTSGYVPSRTFVFALTKLSASTGVGESVDISIFEEAHEDFSLSVWKSPTITPAKYNFSPLIVMNLEGVNRFCSVILNSTNPVSGDIGTCCINEFGMLINPRATFTNIGGLPVAFIVRYVLGSNLTATHNWTDGDGTPFFDNGGTLPGYAIAYAPHWNNRSSLFIYPLAMNSIPESTRTALDTLNRTPTQPNLTTLIETLTFPTNVNQSLRFHYILENNGRVFVIYYSTPLGSVVGDSGLGNPIQNFDVRVDPWEKTINSGMGENLFNENFDSIAERMKRPNRLYDLAINTKQIQYFPYNAFSIQLTPCPPYNSNQQFNSTSFREINNALLMSSCHLGFKGNLILQVLAPVIPGVNCYPQYLPGVVQSTWSIIYPNVSAQPTISDDPINVFALGIQPDIKLNVPAYYPSDYIRTIPNQNRIEVLPGDLTLIDSMGSVTFTLQADNIAIPDTIHFTYNTRFGDHCSFFQFIGFPTVLCKDEAGVSSGISRTTNPIDLTQSAIDEEKILNSKVYKNFLQQVRNTNSYLYSIDKSNKDNTALLKELIPKPKGKTNVIKGLVEGDMGLTNFMVNPIVQGAKHIANEAVTEVKNHAQEEINKVITEFSTKITDFFSNVTTQFPQLDFKWSTIASEIISQMGHCIINPQLKTIVWSFFSTLVNLSIITLSQLHKLSSLLIDSLKNFTSKQPSSGGECSGDSFELFFTFTQFLCQCISSTLNLGVSFIPDVKKTTAIFRCIGEGFRMGNAISTFFRINYELVKDCIIGLFNKYIWNSIDSKELKIIRNFKGLLPAWLEECEFLTDKNKTKLARNSPDFQCRVRVNYLIGRVINRYLIVQKEDSKLTSMLRDYWKRIKDLYDELVATNWFGDMRPAPDGWYFWGETRLGKSEMISALISAVTSKYNSRSDVRKIEPQCSLSYVINAASTFLTGLGDSPFIVIDDLQALTFDNVIQAQLGTIYDGMTCATWRTQQAAVEDKGQTAQPKAIISLSNVEYVNHNHVTDSKALNARFRFKYKVTIDPLILNKDGKPCKSVLEFSDEQKEKYFPKFLHLRFQRCTHPETANSVLEDYINFEQLQEICESEFYKITTANEASCHRRILLEAKASKHFPTLQELTRDQILDDNFIEEKMLEFIKSFDDHEQTTPIFTRYYVNVHSKFTKYITNIANFFDIEKHFDSLTSFFSKESEVKEVKGDSPSDNPSIEQLVETSKILKIAQFNLHFPQIKWLVEKSHTDFGIDATFTCVSRLLGSKTYTKELFDDPIETYSIVLNTILHEEGSAFRYCVESREECDCDEDSQYCLSCFLHFSECTTNENYLTILKEYFFSYADKIKECFTNLTKKTVGKIGVLLLGGSAMYVLIFKGLRLIFDVILIFLDKVFGVKYVKKFNSYHKECSLKQSAAINSFIEVGNLTDFIARFGQEWVEYLSYPVDNPLSVVEYCGYTIEQYNSGIIPKSKNERLYNYNTNRNNVDCDSGTQYVGYTTPNKPKKVAIQKSNFMVTTVKPDDGQINLHTNLTQLGSLVEVWKRNIRYICIRDTPDSQPSYMGIVGVAERKYIMLKHYVERLKVKQKHFPDAELSLDVLKPIVKKGIIEYFTETICNLSYEDVFNYTSRDTSTQVSEIIVWEAPKQVSLLRNIIKHFFNESQLSKFSKRLMIVPIAPAFDIEVPSHIEFIPESYVRHFNDLSKIKRIVGYKGYSGEGKCCSLIVDPLLHKIIGFHSFRATSDGDEGIGFGELVSYEDLRVLDIHEEEVINNRLLPNLESISEDDIERYPEQLRLIGKVGSHQSARDNTKSCIVPSPVHGTVFPVIKYPAHLRPNNEIDWNPMMDGIAKHGKQMKNFSNVLLQRACEIRNEQLIKYCKPQINPRPLTIEEAVIGIPEISLNGLDMRTSPGYPFKKKGESGKYHVIELEEDGSEMRIKSINSELLQLLHLEKELRERKIPCNGIAVDCLKDETLKQAKRNRKGGTRIFSTGSMNQTIAGKQDIGIFLSAYRHCRHELNHGIATNAASSDWKRIYERLIKFPNIIEGDYSDFGPNAISQVVDKAFDGIIYWTQFQINKGCVLPEEGKKWITRLKSMKEEFLNTPHLCRDMIYEVSCGIISGSFMTAELNSEINILYLYTMILQIIVEYLSNTKPRPVECKLTESEYNKVLLDEATYLMKNLTYIIVYGDDFLISVADELKEMQVGMIRLSEYFARYGLKVTNATKGSEIQDYTPISEATYLKRGFRHDLKYPSIVFAPLAKDSIQDQINWVRKDGDPYELLIQSIDSVMRESVQHGEEYYNYVKNKIDKVLQTLPNIDFCFQSYHCLLLDIYYGNDYIK